MKKPGEWTRFFRVGKSVNKVNKIFIRILKVEISMRVSKIACGQDSGLVGYLLISNRKKY
jgi:hypothetical protein